MFELLLPNSKSAYQYCKKKKNEENVDILKTIKRFEKDWEAEDLRIRDSGTECLFTEGNTGQPFVLELHLRLPKNDLHTWIDYLSNYNTVDDGYKKRSKPYADESEKSNAGEIILAHGSLTG